MFLLDLIYRKTDTSRNLQQAPRIAAMQSKLRMRYRSCRGTVGKWPVLLSIESHPR